MPSKKIDWKKYPARVCNSLHYCRICDGDILLGESYYDGGYGKRAHVICTQHDLPSPFEVPKKGEA